MKIGVISDTHGFFDPYLRDVLKGVDHIVHAGDIGPFSLLLELEKIAPTTAVLGNTDMGLPVRLTELVTIDTRKLFLHHIVDPLALSKDLKAEIQRTRPHAVIFGHTHKRFYGQQNGVMYLNPGYAGRPKPDQERSIAILDTGPKDLLVDFVSL